MRFSLIDRIDQLEPGRRIVAVKSLSMAEEYLADHFPGFPVLPGVLMLEAMTQAAAWLIRVSEDFQHSMVVLKEVRNVKYGQFVEPGQTLHVSAEVVDQDERFTTVKAKGSIEGRLTVGARLILERFNLAERNPRFAATDQTIRKELKALYLLLWRPEERDVEETPAEQTS